MNDGRTGIVETRPGIDGVLAADLAAPAVARGTPAFALRREVLVVLRGLQPLRRMGAWAGVGAGLLAFSIMALLLAVLPAVRERDALNGQLAVVQGGARPVLAAAVATPQSFLSKLPGRSELPAIMATIVAQAEASHLELHQGSYEMLEGKGGAGPRYQLTLPVKGRYADVRRFVDGTLTAVPAAALDSISLSRDDINSATVDADLRFLVYLRGRP